MSARTLRIRRPCVLPDTDDPPLTPLVPDGDDVNQVAFMTWMREVLGRLAKEEQCDSIED
jgi:hypothetical protein